jgi:hypothetical protein
MKLKFFDGVIIVLITFAFLWVSTLTLKLLLSFGVRRQILRIALATILLLLLVVVILIIVNQTTDLLDSAVNWLVNTAVWRWMKGAIIAIVAFSIILGALGSIRIKKPWEW